MILRPDIFTKFYFLYKHEMQGVFGDGIFQGRESGFCTISKWDRGIQASVEGIGHSFSYNCNNDQF
jgi:hypothetical protein